MSINPLNDISKVYLEQVSASSRAREAVANDRLDAEQERTNTSMDRLRNQNKRFARVDASNAARKVERDVKKSNSYGPQRPKPGTVTGRRIEDPKPTGSKPSGYRMEETEIDEAVKGADTEMRRAAAAERRTGDRRLSPSTGRGYADQQQQQIAYMDKVTKKNKNVVGLVTKEEAKPNDGNLANNYPPYDKVTRGDVIAGATGNDQMGGKKKKKVKEGFSNWRQDLSEVMNDIETNQKITEKKVKNKIKTSAMGGGIKLGESVENLGGTLIEMVEIENLEGVLDELTESEIFLLSDDLIEEVVEEFFNDCIEEGYDVEYVENTLLESLELSSALLNEAKVTLGHDTKIKSDRLEKVKSAVKKVGKAAARGAGYAVGLAKRAGSAAKREFGAGYERGRGGSSSSSGSQSTSTSSSSSGSSDKPKRSGLLSRIGSKLKSGLKKAVAAGARSVSRGARNVARKMEGGETKRAEAPKATPKPKAEKPSDPWGEPTTPPKQKAKATTKNAAAPKAKAKTPAKKKKSSNLDNLLASIRNEEVQINEMPYQVMGSPDGKKEKKIGKPVKSKKYADARAAELEDTHKKTGGKYRSQYVENVEHIDEKTLTKMEMKKREEIVKSMKDKAADFEKRYPGRGKEVMYATATKMAKKVAEQMIPGVDSGIDKKKEMLDKQKLANMKMVQQKQQNLQRQRLQMQKSGKLPLEAD